MKNNENGRSMIEMLGVLAIIGVLSVGGIAGYAKAMTKYRVNRTIDQVSMTVNGIQTLFASQPTRYAGADNVDILQKAKVISDDMVEDISTSTLNEEQYNQRMSEIADGVDSYGFCNYGLRIAEISGVEEHGAKLSECQSAWDSGNIDDFVQQYYTTETSGKAISTPYGGHMTVTAGNKVFALNLLEVPTEMCVELVTLDWKGTADGCTGIAVGDKSTNGSAMAVSDAVAGCAADYNTIIMTFK